MPISRIETASLASGLVAPTATALTTASGSAPSYSARAWVNFNGTGTVAIRASGNVSSITDNGTGDYTVNFATAMPDDDYSAIAVGSEQGSGAAAVYTNNATYWNSGSFRFETWYYAATKYDSPYVCVSIFR